MGAPVTTREVTAASAARLGRVRSHPSLFAGLVWLGMVVAANLTGNHFNDEGLERLWQLVPFDNLRSDPFGSVWNLHIQPPLWNLTVGVVARWTLLPLGISMQLLMAGFGFVATVLLCDTLHRIGVRARWAVPLTLFVMCMPDVFANAFEPRYELAVTAGVIAIAWVVVRANEAVVRGPWLVWLSVLATAVAMTRTLYHPIWVVILVGGFAWRWRATITRRSVGAAILIPLVVIGGWMLKNEVLFGRFTLNSWSGMNLERAVLPMLSVEDRNSMLASGELSQASSVNPFRAMDFYERALGPCTEAWGPEVLSKTTRDGPKGGANFNAGCYLHIYDLAGSDAISAINQHPNAYIEGRWWSSRRWFALDETFTASPSRPLRALHEAYRIALIGLPGTLTVSDFGMPIFGTDDPINHFSLVALACSLAVVGAAFNRRGRDRDLTLYLAFLTTWTFACGVLFELGEQPRFRSMIDPLVLSFGAVFIARAVCSIRASRLGFTSARRRQVVSSQSP